LHDSFNGQQIELSGLATGMYLIELKSEKNNSEKKLDNPVISASGTFGLWR